MANFTKGDWDIDTYGGKYQIFNDKLQIIADFIPKKEDANLIAAAPNLYETLKEQYFIPDCGGDFCFLATEGMENQIEEPEGGAGHCKYKDQCRAQNAWMIKRNKALAKAEGKA